MRHTLGWGFFALLILSTTQAHATWRPEDATAPQAVQEWFSSAVPTVEAAARLKIDNCCDNADRLMTKFVNLRGHQWMYYESPNCTVKGCRLRAIPDDVVHGEELHAKDPKDDKLPEFDAMRREGVLFIYNGEPSCFWPPEQSDGRLKTDYPLQMQTGGADIPRFLF